MLNHLTHHSPTLNPHLSLKFLLKSHSSTIHTSTCSHALHNILIHKAYRNDAVLADLSLFLTLNPQPLPLTPHSHPVTPRDRQSDPFLKVKIGKTEINDKDNYIPSQLNPIFGKMFELPAVLPLDHTLTITVMDWDRGSAHDLIGETNIDLENRFLSQHHATCGLPESFSK